MWLTNDFFKYLLRFLTVFCILYYGTRFMIGLSSPGGYYSSFVHDYLDYIAVFRKGLLTGSKWLLAIFGYTANIVNVFDLQLQNGRSVHMVYSCLGYGLISFWTAFIFANNGSIGRKLKWIIGGVLIICMLNIIRVAMLLLAINFNWKIFKKVDHHSMFNITVYILIFCMIWLFDRSQKKLARHTAASSPQTISTS